jgi:hypothetical protein
LQPAVNAVEAGLFAVEQMMYGGKLKAFKSLPNWYSELRSYRRDTNGKVVKERDHLMDAMRYLIMSGLAIMQRNAVRERQPQYTYDCAKNMDQHGCNKGRQGGDRRTQKEGRPPRPWGLQKGSRAEEAAFSSFTCG